MLPTRGTAGYWQDVWSKFGEVIYFKDTKTLVVYLDWGYDISYREGINRGYDLLNYVVCYIILSFSEVSSYYLYLI